MRTPSDPVPGDPEPLKPASVNLSTQESTAITPPGAISDTPAAGSTWAHLRLLEELGRGAFGRVFRAWDNTLAREVALKIIRLESADAAALSAVLREGQMLARIRHRHVVTVFGAQLVDKEVGVWMELVRGRTLARMVREDGPLGPEEAAIVGMTLCDALAAVHSEGLLHRDIKAQNVMRESGGRIVLMDFGAGLELIERRRRPELVGTPLYMSPAVLAGATWSPSADLYSVGVLLFYLVSGRFPVEGNSLGEIATAHALGEQKALADVRPGLPEGFSRVVLRALNHRYKTAGAMMRELSAAIPGHEAPGMAFDSPIELSPVTAVGNQTPAHVTPGQLTPMQVTPAPQPGAITTRHIAWAAVAVGVVWSLGMLTSAVYNHSLGRDPALFFSDETLLRDFVWGVRALFPVALYMLMALIGARVFGFAWRAAVRGIAPLTRSVLSIRRRWHSTVLRTTSGETAQLAQWLLTAQAAALGLAIWVFAPFITSFATFLDVAPAKALTELGSGTDLRYRWTFSLLLLAMGFGWWSVWARTSETDRPDNVTVMAAAGAALLTLALLVAPFRLMYQESEIVFYNGQRCHVLGGRGITLQLFCRTEPPRVRQVELSDPALERRGDRDAIFQPRTTDGNDVP